MKNIFKQLIYRLRGGYTIEQLKELGLKVGDNFNPQLGFELDPSHCWLIEIGNNVTFGPHVQILAHDASTCAFLGYAKIGRVSIGNNVFIGAGSIVLPNVSIGDNVIIGAGSVVTHSLPNDMVCAGNPAKVICKMDDYLSKHTYLMRERPLYDSSFTLRENVSPKKKKKQFEELSDGIGYVK